jgi:16S rRNA (cytosine1402-N4)-methyltransferase
MKTKTKTTHILHAPVLAEEVLVLLAPKVGDTYLDLTAGYGGHASLVLGATKNSKAVLCDRDPEAVSYLKSHISSSVPVLHENFSEACDRLLEQGSLFDMILADLGVSSPHLDKANRGFSVTRDGPLDMRMNQATGRTAADIVNGASETELATILHAYGEEPKARKIARYIVENRPFYTTSELALCIKRAYGGYTKHHPAVRSFQALRIAVNDELNLLHEMLPKAVKLLAPGGRLGVITFHSLEDRIVKQFFADHDKRGYEAEVSLLTKKPIVASPDEIRSNPRSRSAKLRGVVKK